MKNPIGDRMKAYENAFRNYIPNRSNVVIRIDGRAFSQYCSKLNKPFDNGFNSDMDEVAIKLCQEIQGAKLAYVQSDEISIILNDYATLKTDAWFANNIQKMVSISASIATSQFNLCRLKRHLASSCLSDGCVDFTIKGFEKQIVANFDSRVFVIPELEEVANYLIFRSRDAHRNSLQALARSLYTQPQLEGKNASELNELIFQKGTNYNNLPPRTKRGCLVMKVDNVWKTVDIPDDSGFDYFHELLKTVCPKSFDE